MNQGSFRRVALTIASLAAAATLAAQTAAPAAHAAPAPQTAAPASAAVPTADDAKAILKKMTTYIAAQKTIEMTIDSDIEVITPQLEKIQFASSAEVLVQRPDKLRGHRKGGYADVELVFDGKTASVYGKSMNAYAQFAAPGTLDQLIDALRSGAGVALPAADLLKVDAYDLLTADVKEAKLMGLGVIDGVECDHLAFRNFDTDWQIWIQTGDTAVPRKMVVTSKTINGAPQYTVRIKSWKTDAKPAAAAFTFVPPAGSKKVAPDALIDLDELPQGLPSRGPA